MDDLEIREAQVVFVNLQSKWDCPCQCGNWKTLRTA